MVSNKNGICHQIPQFSPSLKSQASVDMSFYYELYCILFLPAVPDLAWSRSTFLAPCDNESMPLPLHTHVSVAGATFYRFICLRIWWDNNFRM